MKVSALVLTVAFLYTLGIMDFLTRILEGAPTKPAKLSEAFLKRLEEIHQKTNELDQYVSKYSYLVIGGNGFTGSYVCRELVMRNAAHVRVLSRSPPPEYRRVHNVEYVEGSVVSKEDLERAMEGIDIIYHLAAYTGSPTFGYRKPSERRRAFQINSGGAQNVVDVAKRKGNIKLVVFTSSNDVTFRIQGYSNATESEVDYVEDDSDHTRCHYQASKIQAEKIILGADDKTTGLRTVALRPGGIFGPQEEYALPKVIGMGWPFRRHLVKFTTLNQGFGEQQCDWSFAPNIAFAHSLVIKQLEVNPDNFGGKAYFINDNRPRSTADGAMFESVLSAVGIKRNPIITIPATFLISIAEIMEYLEELFCKIGVTFSPPLTVHEILKATVHHTNSIEKAHNDFGYYPVFSADEAWNWTGEEYRMRVHS